MVLGIDISLGSFITWALIEQVIGFIIGYFILPKAMKWAILSIIVIAVLAYFGLITIHWGGFKDMFASDSLKGLLLLISLPLGIGMVIGIIVKKAFE